MTISENIIISLTSEDIKQAINNLVKSKGYTVVRFPELEALDLPGTRIETPKPRAGTLEGRRE